MATYNFYLSGSNLGIETRNSADELKQNQSVADAGILVDYFNNYITVTSGGAYHSKYLWTDGSILVDGVATTTLAEADELINALGFNGGGTAPTNAGYIVGSQSYPYSEGDPITLPANSQAYEVYNVGQSSQLVPAMDWNQDGNSLNITGGAADSDILQVSYLTAVDVSPPTTKEFVMYVGGQDETGLLSTSIKRNTFGFAFGFVREDSGKFNVSNFDPTKHFLDGMPYLDSGDVKYVGEFGAVYTLDDYAGSDSVFEFGGFIRITEY